MKKAIVTLEHNVPPEVSMMSSSKKLYRNPFLLKKNVSYGYKESMRPSPTRAEKHSMGIDPHAWRLPMPNLLAGSDMTLIPEHNMNEDETLRLPQPNLPHSHVGVSTEFHKPSQVPNQLDYLAKVDLQPWRKMIERLRASGILTNPWANPALMYHNGNRGSLHPTILKKPRPKGELWMNTHVAREREKHRHTQGETPWKPPS